MTVKDLNEKNSAPIIGFESMRNQIRAAFEYINRHIYGFDRISEYGQAIIRQMKNNEKKSFHYFRQFFQPIDADFYINLDHTLDRIQRIRLPISLSFDYFLAPPFSMIQPLIWQNQEELMFQENIKMQSSCDIHLVYIIAKRFGLTKIQTYCQKQLKKARSVRRYQFLQFSSKFESKYPKNEKQYASEPIRF